MVVPCANSEVFFIVKIKFLLQQRSVLGRLGALAFVEGCMPL